MSAIGGWAVQATSTSVQATRWTNRDPKKSFLRHLVEPRISPSPFGALCSLYQRNQAGPNGLSAPWRMSYGTHWLRRAVRTRCVHRFAWASALPKCQARPTVQSVVPIRAGFEYLTLRCTSCGLVYDGQVHTDPLKSDARGSTI
jgi:hypothetical protein